ncbi:hypothetical protein CYFUS_002313 [Cystobacter fuscus]|uniref:Integral membrane bound transporter domain-containing protein n=1 Tax=Cystobacter fuscus TaxID=43 RepID=A0A250J063_9BACT|nr:FUSC family protein [Cystobacter fuscus]ATB36898.1 hypothetical protein CYFUS_002313 [Cystobacter fuscus]
MRHLQHRLNPTHLWDLFVISDPDLGRLRKGLRAALGAGLAALVLSRLARLLGEPPTVTLVGTMVAMMGSQIATDPEPREQRLTTALLLVPALTSSVLGTLAAQVPLLGAAAFAVTIFVSTFVRRFGPRGLALGMIGFFSFFNALFFHAQLSQVPALAGAMVVAVGIAYTVRFVLVPDRPDHALRRTVRAFRKTIDVVLWELADIPEQPRMTCALLRRLLRQADRLSDAALAVEDLASRGHSDLRQQLFELELAANRVLRSVQQVVDSGALSSGARADIRQALVSARVAIRDRDPAAARTMRAYLDRVREAPGDERGRVDAQRLHRALTDLLEASARLPREHPPLVPEPAATPAGKAAPGPLARTGLHPSTRQAIQITVASVIAMGVGYAVSAERWYWAVITAFVIFTRTRSRGDTLQRAWARVLGTVLGVLAGLFLARAVSGHAGIELVSIFVCVFFGFYLIQISYAWMVFWFTTLLSVLYGLLGRFTPALLLLRIEETVIGAVIGAVIALILFPERTTAQIQTSARQVLDAVCEYLEEAVVKRTPETDPARLLDSARVLDARLRDLRTAAQPLTGGLRHFTPRATNTLRTVSELVLSVRHLEMGRGLMEMNDASRELLREAAERLANNARVLAGALGQEAPPRVEPASTLIQEARHRLAPEEAARRGTASPFRLLHWLTRVDDMLTHLARTDQDTPRVLVPWRA